MIELAINPALHALVPKPNTEEYDSIKNSIQKDGQLEPIIVWKEPVSEKPYIVDGHTRYAICKDLGIEPKIEYREFESWLHAEQYAIDTNLLRRHLSLAQKVELAIKSIEIEEKRTKERQKLTLPKKGQKGFQPVSLPNGDNIGRTVDIVSKKICIPSRTISRIKFVLDNGTEQMRHDLMTGKVKPAFAERRIRIDNAHRNPIPLPNGKFRIILCDVPYKYDYELSGAPDYPTLTIEEIINLKDKEGRSITVVFAADAVIFFWSPIPKLEEALEILKAWGFRYVTAIVWSKENDEKSQVGTGHYVRATCELLLIATKGNPGTPSPENRPLGIIKAPRTQHSKKPDCVRRIIRKMYPDEKYLELFGREMVEGWEVWGDQLDLGKNQDSTRKENLDDF